ncbi:MAG: type II CAAX endopeptidase family protein [Vicinamibacterales bacterium]
MEPTVDGAPLDEPAPEAVVPDPDAAAGAAPAPADPGPPVSRLAALAQVVLVSGVPTQIVLAIAALAAGLRPSQDGALSLEFFAIVAFVDTALIAALILWFLTVSRESARDVFLGRQPFGRQIALGLALVPVVFLGVGAIVLTLRAVFPGLHTVEQSPLDAFMQTPVDTAVFFVVAVLAGGVREELQRAFILHRFDQRLGGIRVGLALFTVLFGALHVDQGVDVAIAIGTLGLFWGLVYARRRSLVIPMVNHAGFNGAQVLQAALARALGAG